MNTRLPRADRVWAVRALALALASGLCALTAPPASAAALPGDWSRQQTLEVAQSGLVKVGLPAPTLGAARAGLEDLRLLDPAGREVSYYLERPAPGASRSLVPKSFQVGLQPSATVLTVEAPGGEAIEALQLETPAREFLKAVRVEVSDDGDRWRALASGRVVFRQRGGAEQLRVALPVARWTLARITLDDQRSEPIPVTGARMLAEALPCPSEPLPIRVIDRTENPGQTRLTLDLGTSHVQLAQVEFDAPDPVFAREVNLALRQLEEHTLKEQPVARGTVHRLADPGQASSSDLILSVERFINSRELAVTIENRDSPPLGPLVLRAQRRPVYLAFRAPAPGVYRLLTGNPLCTAPSYDLVSLRANLAQLTPGASQFGPLEPNPDYRKPEALPELPEVGAPIDLADWTWRKPVTLGTGEVHRLDLDLETLARAQTALDDLRVVRDGRQIPFILEPTSITRPIEVQAQRADDPKRPRVSRWRLTLPQADLPCARLTCASSSALFQRQFVISEERTDERGSRTEHILSQAQWERAPGRAAAALELRLGTRPQGDTLWLETDNGDNPAIPLAEFRVYVPVTRLHFKAGAGAPVFLYFGQPSAAAPRYDLSLVGDQLLNADHGMATLQPAERLKGGGWGGAGHMTGVTRAVFWAVLAAVVAGLFFVISRLLPKPQ